MFKHMNAVALSADKFDEIINHKDYYIEEKIKGNRAFVIFESVNTNIKIISRGGKDRTAKLPHLTTHPYLMHYSKVDTSPVLPGTVLDGELFWPGHTDAELAGVLNRKEGVTSSEIIFYAFDIIYYRDIYLGDEPQFHRKDQLALASATFCENPNMKMVCWYRLGHLSNIRMYHKIIQNGGEGVVFKNYFAKYQEAKRPVDTWYKWKKTETHDVIILGFTPAKEGKFAGLVGAIEYGATVNGTVYKIGTCSGMDDVLRKHMTDNPKAYIGRVFEIEAHEKTKIGALKEPRFVRMRDDKTPDECIWTLGK